MHTGCLVESHDLIRGIRQCLQHWSTQLASLAAIHPLPALYHLLTNVKDHSHFDHVCRWDLRRYCDHALKAVAFVLSAQRLRLLLSLRRILLQSH